MKGKWQRLSLEKCCDFFSGTGFPDRFQGHKSGDYPFIKVSDMSLSGNSIFLVGANNWVSKDVASSLSAKIVPAGATAFAKIGAAMLLNRRRITIQDTCFDNNMMAAVSKENIDSKIIYYIFTTLDFAYFSQITALPSLNLSDLKKYQICLPKLKADQQHIADILSTCDEVIEQTEKTIAKYRDIKAGMLQDLFTRGLDANGKLRPKPEDAPELYKDSPLGKIPKEWTVAVVGDSFDLEVGGDLQKEFFSPYKTPVHQYPIFSNSLENSGLYGYTSVPVYPENSITLTGRGSLGHAEYRNSQFDAIIRLVVLKVKKSVKINCKFVTEQLNYDQDFFVESTGVPQLTAPQTSKMRIRIPNLLSEQNMIADRIMSLDTKISAEERTLAKYRSVKLGLMKKLLTPPEGALEA